MQNLYPEDFFMDDHEQARLPDQYLPLGAWAYFGYSLLFSVPVVGWVFLFIFAFSNANINRRNFARSYFCMAALAAVCALMVWLILLATGVTFSRL